MQWFSFLHLPIIMFERKNIQYVADLPAYNTSITYHLNKRGVAGCFLRAFARKKHPGPLIIEMALDRGGTVSNPDVSESKETPKLRRVLGLREAVALGVGGTIGGGIFVLVGAAAGLAGPGVLLAFVLVFFTAGLIALPYAELACRFPQAGGGYAFAQAVFGHTGGFVMGWDYWGAYIFVSGYVTLGFGGYLQALTGVHPTVGALALIAVITLINLKGVRVSGRSQTLIISTALVGLVGFGLLGLPHIQPRNFTPLLPNGSWGLLQAALMAFLAFGGFDMVAAAGEEIDRPTRNLPLAILLTLVIVLGLNFLVATVAIGILPWQTLGASDAPLADTAAIFLGPPGRWLVSAVALLTTAATANAVLVTTSRISFAMARDTLLPARLAAVHPTTGAPYLAVLLNAGLLALVALLGSVSLSAQVGGFLYVCQFLLSLISLAFLHRKQKATPAFRTPFPKIVLPLACGACLVLLASSGTFGIIGGAAWMLVSLPIYYRSRRFRVEECE